MVLLGSLPPSPPSPQIEEELRGLMEHKENNRMWWRSTGLLLALMFWLLQPQELTSSQHEIAIGIVARTAGTAAGGGIEIQLLAREPFCLRGIRLTRPLAPTRRHARHQACSSLSG